MLNKIGENMSIKRMMNYLSYGASVVMVFFALQSNGYAQTDTSGRGMGSGSGMGSGTGSGSNSGTSGAIMGSDTTGQYNNSFYSKADSLVQRLDQQVSLKEDQKNQIRTILMNLNEDYASNSTKGNTGNTDTETGETTEPSTGGSQSSLVKNAIDDVENILDKDQKASFSSFRDTWTQEIRSELMGSKSRSGSGSENNGSGSGSNNTDMNGTGSGSNSGSGTGSGSGSGSGSGDTGSGSGTGTDSGSGSGSSQDSTHSGSNNSGY